MSAREDFLSYGWCAARGLLDQDAITEVIGNVDRLFCIRQ